MVTDQYGWFFASIIKSDYLVGVTSSSKAAPLIWLHVFLMKVVPPHQDTKVPNCIVHFDQDGECEELSALFHQFHYSIKTTGLENSCANGNSECFHCTAKSAIIAMIESADLSFKVWNYAFDHFIWIYNTTPHVSLNKVPYTNVIAKISV